MSEDKELDYEVSIETDLRDAEFDEELNTWLRTMAETCVAHMKYVEEVEEDEPESLTDDDYGLLALERGFLVLYALHTKGSLPVETGEYKEAKQH